jgi:ABC-type branched-subunit amino acid transport system substrate-binding protein
VTHRSRLSLALLTLLLLVVAACGQKSGVAGQQVSAGGENGNGTTATSAPGKAAAHEPDENDKSGVTDDEIVIGIHAPVTGASPVPQNSFDTGKDIYWKFLAESAPDKLFGRKVRVVFADDKFNPNEAVRVCREMVEQENAFLLVGGGGADQITACAKYADEAGVPYLSAGVNEEGLADLSTYYATTLSYPAQAPLIMDLIKEKGFTKVGFVTADTPSFQDAHDAFVKAAEDAELDIVVDTPINKTASPTEALTVVQELKSEGAEVVVLLSSPTVYVTGLAAGARSQSYDPTWIGPGVTSGLNAVLTFGCPAVEKGEFFSPFPGLDVIDELDPDYKPAYAQFAPGEEADDIGLALWALNKALAQMFEATGEDLGRAAFMNTIESTDEFANGVYPPIRITPDDHFGGTGAHLLDADCASDPKQYKTTEQFVVVK